MSKALKNVRITFTCKSVFAGSILAINKKKIKPDPDLIYNLHGNKL